MEALSATDLAVLDRLRARFLDGSNAGGGYWRSEAELGLYNATFAERIGWKWDAVLAELLDRGWRPQARHVCDFGCGSGVAGRRVLGTWGDFTSLTVADVSSLAMSFAERRAKEAFPGLTVNSTKAESLDTLPPGTLLLVSHVINELTPATRERLLALVRQAEEVIWVEAGTHADSRALIAVRETVRDAFTIVAPCTHAAPCGMLAGANAPHWCHHFGRVPSAVFQDAAWAHFSKELGIDLRSLPYSFLVLSRTTPPLDPGASRLIGHPRESKGRMQVLACAESGVNDLLLQKRDAPQLFKDLQKARATPIQRWQVQDGKIHPLSLEAAE